MNKFNTKKGENAREERNGVEYKSMCLADNHDSTNILIKMPVLWLLKELKQWAYFDAKAVLIFLFIVLLKKFACSVITK